MAIVSQYHDSELGRWSHTEWRPQQDNALGWAVERVWDFDGMAAQPQERVFPNGLVELIIQLDARYLDVHECGTMPTPALCITGIHTRPIVVRAPRQRGRVLGIRLHPAGAWAVMAHPLCELANLTADLQDLLGRTVVELAEQCHDAGSGIERVSRTVAWLDRQLRHPAAGVTNPAVHWVACGIAATGGTRAIADLRAETGITHARLTRLFSQQVGVTPKRLARIHRFGRALTMLTRNGNSLADVALGTGYYDQPHMNAEFQEFAGLTPREFMKAARYPNSMSLPEPA